VVLGAPRDMLTQTAVVADVAPYQMCRRVPPPATWKAPRAASRGRSAARDSGRHCVDPRSLQRSAGVRGRLGTPVAARSAPGPLRQPATTTTSATSASASTRSSPSACVPPTSARDRRAAGRDDHRRLYGWSSRRGRSRSSCTCTAGAEELGRVYQGELLVKTPGCRRSRPR